jgi:hypothetical protein
VDDSSTDLTGTGHLRAPAQPRAEIPDDVLGEPLLRSALAMTFSRGGMFLMPILQLGAAAILGVIVVDVVGAFSAPTVVSDAQFVPLEVGHARVIATLALALLAGLASLGVCAVVTLRAAAAIMGRAEPGTRDLVRAAARRWPFLLLCGVLWVLATALALAGAYLVFVVMRFPYVVMIVGLVIALAVVAPVFLMFPVAIVHRIGARAAWRRLREVLVGTGRVGEEARSATRVLVTGVVVLGSAMLWGVGRGVTQLGPVLGPLVESMATLAVSTVAGTLVTVGLVRVYLRAVAEQYTSSRVEGAGCWAGLDEVAPARAATDAAPHVPTLDASPRALRSPSAGWAVVVAVLIVAPLLPPAVATWNPTPAATIELSRLPDFVNRPSTVAHEDGGVDVVSDDIGSLDETRLVRGTGIKVMSCEPGADKCIQSATPVRDTEWRLVTAAADPAGGILLVTERSGVAAPVRADLVLVSCTAATCDDDATVDRAVVLVPYDHTSWDLPRTVAVDAVPGTYAVVAPYVEVQGDGQENGRAELIRCADARCDNPDVIDLGPLRPYSPAALRLTDDGTAYILVADSGRKEVKLSVVRRGATTVEQLASWSLQPDMFGSFSAREGDLNGFFSLELRPDGRPVVIYRDTVSGKLRIMSCNDSACRDPSTGDVDIPVDASHEPTVTMDSTGRPLIAADERGRGVVMYSCDDELCTTTTSRLLVTGSPPYSDALGDPVRYLVVDAQERPVLLYQMPTGHLGEYHLLRCAERRCGM